MLVHGNWRVLGRPIVIFPMVPDLIRFISRQQANRNRGFENVAAEGRRTRTRNGDYHFYQRTHPRPCAGTCLSARFIRLRNLLRLPFLVRSS